MKAVALLFVACVLSGTAVPMPEDVAIIAAGTTVESLWTFLALSVAGILGLMIRDGVFFAVGHFAGEGLLSRPLVQRFFGEARLAKGRELVERRGGRAVLVSRFLIGFRAAGFLVAGALGVRPRDFVLWDGIGLVVSVPVVLGLGFIFGEPITEAILWILDHKIVVLGGAVLLAVGWWLTQRGPAVDDPV